MIKNHTKHHSTQPSEHAEARKIINATMDRDASGMVYHTTTVSIIISSQMYVYEKIFEVQGSEAIPLMGTVNREKADGKMSQV